MERSKKLSSADRKDKIVFAFVFAINSDSTLLGEIKYSNNQQSYLHKKLEKFGNYCRSHP